MSSTARQLARARQGLLILARGATPIQLGPVIRTLVPEPPWQVAPHLHVCLDPPQLAALPAGAHVLLRVRTPEDAVWLNINRPLLAIRELRVLLWADAAATDHLLRDAVDFSDWITRIIDVPPAVAPPFALQGLRAALDAQAPIVWRGPSLLEALAHIAPERPLLELDGRDAYRSLVHDLTRPGLPLVTHLASAHNLTRWAFALAQAGRSGSWIARDPELPLAGLCSLHAQQSDWDEATAALTAAGWPHAALLAAWLDLEPERIEAAKGHSEPDLRIRPVPFSQHTTSIQTNLDLTHTDAVLLEELAHLGDTTPSAELIARLAEREHIEVAMELALTRGQRGERTGCDDLTTWLLAYGRSAEAAELAGAQVSAHERHLHDDPTDAGVQRDLSVSLDRLGSVEVQAGNLARAREIFARSLEIREELVKADPHSAQSQRDLSVSLNKLGDVEVQAGNRARARELFARDLAIAEELAKAEPHSAQAQRDLSISLNTLGDVEVQAGNLARARELFARSLEIREELAKADPHSAQAQRDLSISLNTLGDVEVQAGNLTRAHELIARCSGILEELAKADPHSARAQRDLSISLNKLGDVEVQAGKLARARELFARSLKVAEELAKAGPHSTQAQRDLSVSLNKLGDVDVQAGNLARARELFARGSGIIEELAKADPHSAQAQRDLSISLNKLGDVEVHAGNLARARALFARSLKVAEELAKADPHSAQAQRDLSVSLERLGDVEVQAGNLARARELFARSLEIREELAKADPHSAQAQRDLSVSLERLGEVQAGNLARARELFARDLAISEELAKADPHSAQAQRDLASSCERMAAIEAPAALRWLARAVKIRSACQAQDPTNAIVARDHALALLQLSDAQLSAGDHSSALEPRRKAASIFVALRRANALEARFIPLADQLAAAFPDA